MAKAKQVNEGRWDYGSDVRVERGPAPGEIDRASGNPNHAVRYGFYVYQQTDEDPHDTQDGVWREMGFHFDVDAAHKQASGL